MSFLLTKEQVLKLLPTSQAGAVDTYLGAINQVLTKYGIDENPRRVRYFMAQTYFETQSYTRFQENLMYTHPEVLVNTWRTRFTLDQSKVSATLAYAPDYINNPEKLANLVYAGRYGNGDVASGDGWKYRGRGGIHTTFLSGYQSYSKAIYGDDRVVQNPDLLLAPVDAFMSAGLFWNNNRLNAQADTDSFTNATKIINGSTDTVLQRIPVLDRMNAALTW